jgi:hypothetical protein
MPLIGSIADCSQNVGVQLEQKVFDIRLEDCDSLRKGPSKSIKTDQGGGDGVWPARNEG